MSRAPALLLLVVLAVGIFVGYCIGYKSLSGKTPSVERTSAPSPVCVVLPTATTISTVTTTVIKTVEQAPSGAWVEALLDEDYFSVLTHWIERANTSIHVVMYVAKCDPNESGDPVNQLLYKLAYAQSRGVDVKVVVDDETAKSYPQTIAFLKNSSIDVKLDESFARTTHAKLVIIDGRVVAVGSHNWTESALRYNHEASVLIISEDIAKQFEEYFDSIWSSGRAL